LRAVSVVAAGAAAAVLLALVGALVFTILTKLGQKRLDRLWTDAVGPPAVILDRVAPRGQSQSAMQLVRAAGAFGVELVPDPGSDNLTETPALRQVGSELRAWCDAVMTRSAGSVIPVPDKVRSTLDERADAMSALIAALTGDVPILWQLEGAMGGGAGIPAPGRLTDLHRWLAAAAVAGFDRGDLSTASAAMEASWRLNQATLARPEPELRLAAYSVLELELAVLRSMSRSVDAETWATRLDELEPVKRLEEWVLVEAYSLPASTKQGTILDDEGVWPTALSLAVGPARKWLLASASESLCVSIATLSPADLVRLDPDLRFIDAHHRIPRWNGLARDALPNPWSEWLIAARAGLAVELASEAMRLETMNVEQLDELLTTLPRRAPSRVPGAIWTWAAEADGLRIRLAVEASRTPHNGVLWQPPLEHLFEVDRSLRSAAEGGAPQ
jgi:hypothetical protein